MTTEPTYWLIIALAVATTVSIGLAVAALVIAHNARRQLESCAAAVTQLEQAMQSAAAIFAESDERMSAAYQQIDRLTQRQGTLDAAGSQPGFQQAIALTQRGASLDELVEICGVSQGEARLIQTMYAQTPGGVASDAPRAAGRPN